MEQKLDMEHRMTVVEDRSKSNTKRLDEIEKRQDNLEVLTSSVSVLATKQEHMETDVKEIKADVKSLTEKPGKRWDAIVAAAISAGGLPDDPRLSDRGHRAERMAGLDAGWYGGR